MQFALVRNHPTVMSYLSFFCKEFSLQIIGYLLFIVFKLLAFLFYKGNSTASFDILNIYFVIFS
jgi:hypothetical protein